MTDMTMWFPRNPLGVRGDDVNQNDWQWEVASSDLQHTERVPLMRAIPYEETARAEGMEVEGDRPLPGEREKRGGQALSLNISSGGMLLLMMSEPLEEAILRVEVPTPVSPANVPTLVEVCWTRPVPHPIRDVLYFVGVKFVF